VVGAGPIGLVCGIALARRGAEVTLVDRDPGPHPDGSWKRHGVMQFQHPHFFRSIVAEVLQQRLPDVWDALVAAGGVPAPPPGLPFGPPGLKCRRSTFERAIREVAAVEAGLTIRIGHADRLLAEGGRVRGVVVDGQSVDADLVISATGRSSRFADTYRARGEGGPCGFSYVSRMYRARPGVELPESATPVGAVHRGYQAIMFPQDDRTISALVVLPSADDSLAQLRDSVRFDAAAAVIPVLAPWTDPARFEPITPAMPGGGLTNTFRGQLDDDGRCAVAGLFFVGDAVCTTNPAAGRGVSLGLRQAHTLLGLLDEQRADPRDASEQFDAWCREDIRPWYLDHVHWDATLLRRFAGEDLDLSARIPSDVICAAAAVDPQIAPAVGPYLGMLALPSVLDPVEDRARAVLATGWRPEPAEGPSRDEIADVLLGAAA
jgi:2-polyprenyl-6-methoxyphenol hydroxylase-like FAD-dependent oxidoreductase